MDLPILRVGMFLELHYYAFGLLDPCHEKDTDITLFHIVYGVPKYREDYPPPPMLYLAPSK